MGLYGHPIEVEEYILNKPAFSGSTREKVRKAIFTMALPSFRWITGEEGVLWDAAFNAPRVALAMCNAKALKDLLSVAPDSPNILAIAEWLFVTRRGVRKEIFESTIKYFFNEVYVDRDNKTFPSLPIEQRWEEASDEERLTLLIKTIKFLRHEPSFMAERIRSKFEVRADPVGRTAVRLKGSERWAGFVAHPWEYGRVKASVVKLGTFGCRDCWDEVRGADLSVVLAEIRDTLIGIIDEVQDLWLYTSPAK